MRARQHDISYIDAIDHELVTSSMHLSQQTPTVSPLSTTSHGNASSQLFGISLDGLAGNYNAGHRLPVALTLLPAGSCLMDAVAAIILCLSLSLGAGLHLPTASLFGHVCGAVATLKFSEGWRCKRVQHALICGLLAARGQVGAGAISAGAGPQASISGAVLSPAPAPAIQGMGPRPAPTASQGGACAASVHLPACLLHALQLASTHLLGRSYRALQG